MTEAGKGIAVLAYSGGLDTSVAIAWIKEHYGLDVVTVTVDVGQEEDLAEASARALENGALKTYLIDARKEFAEGYIAWAIKANALYEGKYPLSTALARPLIARKVAEVASLLGATYAAHGCTGKGNDQVRFELTFRSLNPDLKIIAPIREWNMNRDDELLYAQAHGIRLRSSTPSRYSTDENLWGRSIEGGELEDASVEPPEEIYAWTSRISSWPDGPEYVEVEFEQGLPVALDGRRMNMQDIIVALNHVAGRHGVGRIDHIEDRYVGIKSRENYECPAAVVLLSAHRALESLVLTREMLQFKSTVEARFSELVYAGFWFSELTGALMSFLERSQQNVSGKVRVRLYKGGASVAGISSPHALYRVRLSTYSRGDTFNQRAAEGFIYIAGLPVEGNAVAELKPDEIRERPLERKIQENAQ